MTDCLFCKIVEKTIPSNIVYEDERVIAFEDINPQAPTHQLVIPREHIATLNDTAFEDEALLGHMLLVGKQLAIQAGIEKTGYRTVFNCNAGGGQEVYHIHLHVLGGRQMTWPPG